MRWSPEQLARIAGEGAGAQLALAFVGSLVAAYVLAHFVRYTSAETAAGGAKTGLWLWLGFVVTTNLNTVFFEFRPRRPLPHQHRLSPRRLSRDGRAAGRLAQASEAKAPLTFEGVRVSCPCQLLALDGRVFARRRRTTDD
jgi:hypothetical protein